MKKSTIAIINAHAEEIKKAMIKANWMAITNPEFKYHIYISDDGVVSIREYRVDDDNYSVEFETENTQIDTICYKHLDNCNAPHEQHAFKEDIDQYFARCIHNIARII